MLLKAKELKEVFAAFMQCCIQSTVMLLNLLLMSKGLKMSNTLYIGSKEAQNTSMSCLNEI